MSVFYMPVKYFLGNNIILNKFQDVIKQYNRVLIITGKSSKLNNSLNHVVDILKSNNCEYAIFDEIIPNPPTTLLQKIKDKSYDFKTDCIIGIGGGSHIDTAKAVSLMIANDISPQDIFSPDNCQRAIPIVAIPTTSGTGTEVTQYSVINNVEKGIKAGFGNELIFPKYSFLDPQYTYTLSTTVTRDTALDALSHLFEGVFSNKRNETVYPLIYDGVSKIINNLEKALKHPDNYNFRKNLMIASLYGGIVIAQTSTTLQHAIGYPLTFHLNISHGYSNALAMPYIIDVYGDEIKEIILDILQYAGISNLDNFYKWLEKLGVEFTVEKLKDYNLEEFADVTSKARNMALNPVEISYDKILEIYKKIAGMI